MFIFSMLFRDVMAIFVVVFLIELASGMFLTHTYFLDNHLIVYKYSFYILVRLFAKLSHRK